MSAPIRARALLSRLPDGPITGAEVGVYDGRMSEILLKRPSLTLVMVDAWAPDARYIASGDPRASLCMKAAYARAMARTAPARRMVIRARSTEAAHQLPDASLDFVFIDADHSEDAVREDITAWLPKVRPGGLFGGHDYGDPAFPGVRRAVDEAFGGVELGEDRTWWIRR